jgi:hypothetical protein
MTPPKAGAASGQIAIALYRDAERADKAAPATLSTGPARAAELCRT